LTTSRFAAGLFGALLLFVIAVVPRSTTAQPANAVRDPGFESGSFSVWQQCGDVPAIGVQPGAVHASRSARAGVEHQQGSVRWLELLLNAPLHALGERIAVKNSDIDQCPLTG